LTGDFRCGNDGGGGGFKTLSQETGASLSPDQNKTRAVSAAWRQGGIQICAPLMGLDKTQGTRHKAQEWGSFWAHVASCHTAKVHDAVHCL